jgi:Transglycosylase SLT domain
MRFSFQHKLLSHRPAQAWICLCLCLLVPCATAMAATPSAPTPPSQLCETSIAAAERSQGIPNGLLSAIGRVESGRPDPQSGVIRPWPWTIDVDGVGVFFDTKEQAIAAVEGLQAEGVHSIDVGCVQVNLLYHPHAFATVDDAFDPWTNALYGASFLHQLFLQSSDWDSAAAAYHSQSAALGAEYAQRVMMDWGHPGQSSLLGTRTSPYGRWPPPGVVYGALPPSNFAYRAFTTSAVSHTIPAARRVRRYNIPKIVTSAGQSPAKIGKLVTSGPGPATPR